MTRHFVCRFDLRRFPRVLVGVVRIFSDLHFGDRASSVRRLADLRPLFDGASAVILNGDTLDSRPSPIPADTIALCAEVREFFAQHAPSPTFLTGNHDSDISTTHALDLAGGRVFATHGDVLFDTIVPWSRDVPLISELLAAEFAGRPDTDRLGLAERLAIWRRVAGKIPQRHQSEKNPLKYAMHYAADTIWPPLRVWRILQAWRDEPRLAAELMREHRPKARIIVTGHTHRPGIHQTPDGRIAINTGSFCPPLGGCAVDVTETHVTVRRVILRGGEFRLGATVAQFPLARAG